MTETKKENISYYSFNPELITIGNSNLEIEGKKKNFGKAMMIELPDGAYLVKFFEEEEKEE